MLRWLPLPVVAASALTLLAVAPGQARKSSGQPLTVMSYNMFQGSELSHTLVASSLAAIAPAVAADYQNVIASNIPERAKAMAAEIKANGADLIGLQEAVLWRTSPASTQPIQLPGKATSVSYDFVALLVKALSGLGVHYRAVAITNNLDVQATGEFPNGTKQDVRFTDRVAILARQGVTVSNVQQHNFKAHDNFKLLGFAIPVPDGWASVDARVGTRTLRYITTHLAGIKDASATAIRTAEAKEIASGPAKTKLPVVFTCDCNSIPTSKAHGAIAGAGLRDQWAVLNHGKAGLTCCHRASPTDPEVDVADPNPMQGIIDRIDYIWTTRPFSVLGERTVGLNPADRTTTSPRLWPSDHLGLVASLSLQ
jgi:endonuclease/exonuclease/phosphatase family metal-dependent hydrolase